MKVLIIALLMVSQANASPTKLKIRPPPTEEVCFYFEGVETNVCSAQIDWGKPGYLRQLKRILQSNAQYSPYSVP